MVVLLKHRYRIISSLSRGGFGETFLAQDRDMPSARCCVIKKLIPIANNPQVYQVVKKRFEREAIILEKLGDEHPQIPRLYAYFEESGQFYLVQEWIEGITLLNKVKQEGRLDENLVRDILINILSVLAYVHSHNIVHRDIKPTNIIFRHSDDKPVLIDFGAVKETMGTILANTEGSTYTLAIGTPGFMPTEQLAGRPVFASDIYSLGITAIYLLTGKHPQDFNTDPATGEIVWRQDAPYVSPALAAILDKATHPNWCDRYFSAKEMLDAIKRTTSANSHKLFFPRKNRSISENSTRIVPAAIEPDRNHRNLYFENAHSSSLNDWQKATIIGSIVGTFMMATLIINSFIARQSEPQSVSSNLPSNSQVRSQQEKTPETNPSQVIQPTQPKQTEVSSSPKQQNTPETSLSPVVRSNQSKQTEVSSSTQVKPRQVSESIVRNSSPVRSQSKPRIINNAIDESEAIKFIEKLYVLLSNRSFEQARLSYGSRLAAQFNPNFFTQFRRVTINNLQKISQTNSSIDLIGENTYYYLDGSTQREQRSYTVSKVDEELKITNSKFIKVIKSR
ncbi:protein kinase [Candidatus Gracilibacteria bacterium]|nr:protein kinase [Candidatus Gracilibacteria bacterium]NJM86496.1 protein kinase [Hydrococcus sp. RU_2_2]NJP20087.1 protein kinase [Hydrococcus sp. CRU_1_1]